MLSRVFRLSSLVALLPLVALSALSFLCGTASYAAQVLTLSQSSSASSAAPGTAVTYTLVYGNSGDSSATNVILTDVLPAGVTYFQGSMSAGGFYDPASRTLRWALGTLAPGVAGRSVSFQAILDANTAVGSLLSNTANLSSTEISTPVTSNTVSISVFASKRGDWWMEQHDMKHTSRSPFPGPATPTLKWKSASYGSISGSPVFAADGTMYIGSEDSNLYAINPDGSRKWAFPLGKWTDSSPVVWTDGTIYIESVDGNLYAINPDGTQKWVIPTGCTVAVSPVLGADGTIYLGSNDGYLYAYNPDSTKKWGFKTNLRLTSSPAIGADGTIYLNADDGHFFAINPDGTKWWAFSANGSTTPAIGQDGTIYIAGGVNLYAYSPNGIQKWVYPTGGGASRQDLALGKDGTIYLVKNGDLLAFTPDGTLKWQVSLSLAIFSMPIVGADGTIYAVYYINGGDNGVYAINPSGTITWKFSTKNDMLSSPAIAADGTLYVGAAHYPNSLYAISGQSSPTLTVSQTVYPPAAAPGAVIRYTLEYGNPNNSEVSNVVITDPLPLGIQYLTGSATAGGNYNSASRTLTWSLGRMSNNASSRIAFSVTVDAVASVGSTINNTAAITCSEIPAGSSCTVPLTVVDNKAQGDWWMFLHDAQHTGRSQFNGPSTPTKKWNVAPAGNLGLYNPAFAADGTIYIGSVDDHLYALNPDGTTKWAFETTGGGVTGTPAVGPDGTIYVGSGNMNFYAINSNGTKKWLFATNGMIDASPAIGIDGTIYIGSEDHNLYALDPNGRMSWVFTTGDQIWSSAAIGPDGTIYVGSEDGNLYAINPDGTKKWSFATTGYLNSSPAIGTDGTIYVGSTAEKKLYAINPDGTKKWAFLTGGAIWASPAIGKDGTIYVGSIDKHVYALNADGTQKWAFLTGSSVETCPALGADGIVYIGSDDDNLYAINPDGTKKWSFRSVKSSPFFNPSIGMDGTLYVSATDHFLYAITDPKPVLTLTQIAAPASVAPGATLTCTLNYSNSGPVAASNVLLNEVLPASLNYLEGSAESGGSYAGTTRTMSWSLGTLAAGGAGSVTFQATMAADAAVGSNITDIASISCSEVTTPVVSDPVTITIQGNSAPTIDPLPDQTLPMNAGMQTISLTGISAGGAGDTGQTLQVTAGSNNTALIPAPAVQYTNPQATGTLTFQPAANKFGTAVLTVTVLDNGGTALGGVDTTTVNFTVTVPTPAYEADVSPWPTFDGQVTVTDWAQVGRFVVGQDTAMPGSQFQRADCAPCFCHGDGRLTLIDWVQAGRFAMGLDALVPADGPTAPGSQGSSRTGSPGGSRSRVSLAPATLTRGKTGAVRVVCDAQGNESAVGFTLNFNAKQMKFLGAKLVGATSSAMLDLNTKQAAAGCLGVALMLPLPKTIPVGKQPIIELTFQPLTRGLAPLTFSDQIITREVAGVSATVLPVSFVNGIVVIR